MKGKAKKNNKRGFSFAEVIVAVVILLFVTGIVASLYPAAYKRANMSNKETVSTVLAQQKMETTYELIKNYDSKSDDEMDINQLVTKYRAGCNEDIAGYPALFSNTRIEPWDKKILKVSTEIYHEFGDKKVVDSSLSQLVSIRSSFDTEPSVEYEDIYIDHSRQEYDVINYGSYSFKAVRGSVSKYEDYVNWWSVWNEGPAMSYEAKQLLNSTGCLNGVSGEIMAAILGNNESYYSNEVHLPNSYKIKPGTGGWMQQYEHYDNTFSISQQEWMKSTDPGYVVASVGNYLSNVHYGGRTSVQSANSIPSTQICTAQNSVTKVSTSEPVYSGSNIITKKDEKTGLIKQVVQRTYDVYKTNTTNIKTASVTVNRWDISGSSIVSPIVLNLNGNDKLGASNGEYRPHKTFDFNNSKVFDLYGDGFPVLTEWVTSTDGLLCVPKPDGTIDGTCLFGNVDGFNNGFEKLAQYDSNNNKILEAKELGDLRVWVDKNTNAVPDKGEVFLLEDLGITSLNLNHRFLKSTFVANGQTYTMWDWYPNVFEIEKKANDITNAEDEV